MRIYTGKVENRNDPLKLGRCQVRVMGVHTSDTSVLPTNDLPWSHPVSSINSSAVNGIGTSNTGIQEGSIVIVWFADGDKNQQLPIILGTVAGIPQDDGDNPLSVQQSEITFDENTQQATIPNVPEANVSGEESAVDETNLENARPARTFTLSTAGVDLIKQFEGFSSTAYVDNTQYSIGYGSGTWKGQAVTATYPGIVTEAEASEQLKILAEETFGSAVKRNVRALITQQMYDAMVSLAYNIGTGGFGSSTVVADINRQQYESAASAFNMWNKSAGTVLPALVRRRKAEEQFFLSGGIPNGSGETVPAAGYEGNQGNTPVGDAGSDGGIIGNPTSIQSGNYGANTGVPSYYNEPDTNRLARHEDIDRTSVYQKEASRWRGAQRFDGSTWNQPEIPYNTDYPFNKVTATESGHVFELDDTPRAERINLYHRTGSYLEIDHNGTQTNRVAGDRYDFSERNHYEAVRGSKIIYVEGEIDVVVKNGAKLNIQGQCDIVVNGNANVTVGGNMDARVQGNTDLQVGGTMNTSVVGDYRVRASNIYFEASGNYNVNGDAGVKIDGSRIDIGNGADRTNLSTPTIDVEKKENQLPEFSPLIVNSRSARQRESYEVPEDGDAEPFRQTNVDRGLYEADQLDIGTVGGSSTPVPNQEAVVPNPNCDVIFNMDNFSNSLQLSNRFQLGAFTKNGTRPPVNQQGLTKQQIVCNLKGVAQNILEHVLTLYPNMIITSGFRRPGDVPASSRTSQHYLGQAVDIVLQGFTRQQHFEAVSKLVETLPAGFDQVILEYSGARTVWIHLSWKYDGNRRSFFTMRDHRTLAQNFAYVAETA